MSVGNMRLEALLCTLQNNVKPVAEQKIKKKKNLIRLTETFTQKKKSK